MKKVLVIGCPGSGKSTFSRALRDKTGLPLHYLDMLFHKSDKTTVSQDEFDSALSKILETQEWIIDGNYLRTLQTRLEKAQTVFWFDLPLEVCLMGIASRRGVKREDMPWIEEEPDEEFLDFIRDFDKTVRPKIISLLEEYADKNIYIFKSRDQADEFLNLMQ